MLRPEHPLAAPQAARRQAARPTLVAAACEKARPPNSNKVRIIGGAIGTGHVTYLLMRTGPPVPLIRIRF